MYQQRIREQYDELSPGYRRIAHYVLDHYREAAFMTAAQLARAADVDTTSVVRFAQRLGYRGFPELSADIQGRVKRDLREMYEPGPGMDGTASVFWNSLIEDRNMLDALLRENDPSIIGQAVDAICAAHRIMVVGEAASASLADVLAQRLTSLGLYAWNSGGDMLGRIALSIQLEPGDAVIGLAPTNASAGVAVVLQIAAEIGVHTIAIVGTDTNRAARVAAHVIYAPARTVGLMYSPTASMSVIHALGQAVALRRAEHSAEWAWRGERLIRRYIEAMRAQPPVTMAEVISDASAGMHHDPLSAQAYAAPDDQPAGADAAAGDTEAGAKFAD